MHTFEITIQRKSGDVWPVVVEQSASAEFLPVRNEGTLRLDLTELRSQATPKDYGTVLGKALFQDKLLRAFDQALAKSEDYLRVLLFVEADDLKILRWERLCAPLERGWDFLALTQRAPFCLYLPSLNDRRFPPIGRRDLRALLLVASPDGLERYRLQPFDVTAAVSSVRTALGEIPCEVLARIEGAVGPPTLDALYERITAEHYTLLHVVCHGQFLRESGETVLYWATADQRVEPVAGTRLLDRLSRLRGARGLPHFAFLGTCESARAEAEGALGGLAQRIVRDLGMPAVVAMTETVSVTTAQALGTAFYGRLRDHGEVDRALVEACAGLAERYDITVPALYSRLGGRPLFSDTPDRPLTHAEIGFGLERLETLLAARAPVLEEIFQTQAVHLRGTLGTDVTALSVAAGQEREQALVEVNKLCGEALDLSFKALALGQEPPAYDDRCPFRGLYPFRVKDREFFCGREALIEHLRQKLAENPFLPVLGPSGSGKSSLVLAGLLPALQAQEPDLQMAYLTPGADPLTQLEASVASVHDSRTVLVVDQFEELFTLCADQYARQAFLDRLLALAEKRRVVITMRADFWGECASYHDLKDIMQARQELIAPMDITELRRAMELQASKVGLRFEADLSHTILEDVQGEPGAMPLLQHALLELWKRRHGRWLRVEEYRAIGGVQQAMARTADDLYERLSPGEQERVRDIFMRLTRLDDDAVPGEARRDTRRRVGLQELMPAASDPAIIRALVSRLADGRLVVTSRNEAAGREEVEVAHEALIRYWPRLRRWLDEDRASLRLRDTIRQAALEWEAGGREDSLLVDWGGRLADAEVLSTHASFPLNRLELDYVHACLALQARQQAEKEAQQRRELEAAQQLAEERRQRLEESERLRRISIAQALAAQAPPQQGHLSARQDERAALMARQAYFFNQRSHGYVLDQVDNALRTVLSVPYFSIVLHGHENAVRSVAFSLDGTTLASGSRDGTVRLWDLGQPETTPLILGGRKTLDNNNWVTSVAFSPDGTTLASGNRVGTVQLWDLGQPGADPRVLRGDQIHVTSVAFSPDGTTLASGSFGSPVQLWDLSQLEADPDPRVLRGHEHRVGSVAFSPDGTTLALGSSNGPVWLLDLGQPETAPLILGDQETWVHSVAFSSDGTTLASNGDDGTVQLWDLSQPGADPRVLRGHEHTVSSVAFNLDGTTLASGSDDGTVRLWDLSQREADPRVLRGHEKEVSAVAFSPDGLTLASGGGEGTVQLWDLGQPGADPRVLRGHEATVSSVAFSPNGTTLASGSGDGTVRLWDLSQREADPRVLRGHQAWVPSVAFSLDGTTLASGGDEGTIRLWDLSQPGADPRVLRGHEHTVSSVAFNLDGTTLASGSNDGTVRLWDLSQREADPRVLRGHEKEVSAVAFSPDGLTLASGSRDKTIRIWIARTETLAAMVCKRVGRNLTMDEWRRFVGPDIPYERTCPNLPPGEGTASGDQADIP